MAKSPCTHGNGRGRTFPAAAAVFFAAAVAAGCFPGSPERTALSRTNLRERAARELEESRMHLLPEGLLVYRIDWPDTPAGRYERARRQADGAYFHGLYTAALAQRAAVTGEEPDRKEAIRAYRALHMLAEKSGYEGLVARTYGKRDPSSEEWYVRTDTSADQVTGFVWGSFWALRFLDDEEVRGCVGRDSLAIVRHLKRHEMRFHMAPGEPCEYGKYDPDVMGFLTIGHRAAGALAIACLALAANPGNAECEDFMDALVRRDFHRKARWFYSWFPHSAANTVNFLLNIFIVHALDESPHRRKFYMEAADSAWSRSHDWQMAMYAAVYKSLGGKSHPEDIEDSLRRLRNLPDRNTWYKDEETAFSLCIVPLEKRPSTSSYWSGNPWRELTGHAGGFEPVRIARVDFLSAYWFGRLHGFYSADE